MRPQHNCRCRVDLHFLSSTCSRRSRCILLEYRGMCILGRCWRKSRVLGLFLVIKALIFNAFDLVVTLIINYFTNFFVQEPSKTTPDATKVPPAASAAGRGGALASTQSRPGALKGAGPATGRQSETCSHCNSSNGLSCHRL